MSKDFKKFLQESTRYERDYKQERKDHVNRFEKLGLLEGVEDRDKHTLAQLLQNQTKRLVYETSRTGTSQGSEEWSGIALPMVRKIFVEQLAKKLVHTFSLDQATGLVFYLDFVLDKTKPEGKSIYEEGESVYGVTDEDEVSGGFYGGDRFSYSQHYYDTVADVVDTGLATWAQLKYHRKLEDAISEEDNIEDESDEGKIKWLEVVLDEDWMLDEEALSAHIVENTGVDAVLRQFTELRKQQNGDVHVRFYFNGSGVHDASGDVKDEETATIHYVRQNVRWDRGDYEIGKPGVESIDEMNIKVFQKEIIANTRKLKAELTPELIQDLDSYQSLDAQKEVATMLSSFIEQEEDTEILNMLSKAANGITSYWSALPGRYVNDKTGEIRDEVTFTQAPNEWWKTLGTRIRDVANRIHKRTLRGSANWMVCSPRVATLLESFNGFQTTGVDTNKYSMGVTQAGTLDGEIAVYKNPYYKENEILLGFKGSSFLEAGAVYGTYLPLMLTPPLTDPDTFSTKQGIMTRNGKLVLRPEFYGKIYIRDLDTV